MIVIHGQTLRRIMCSVRDKETCAFSRLQQLRSYSSVVFGVPAGLLHVFELRHIFERRRDERRA
jgi:hypothetical protein